MAKDLFAGNLYQVFYELHVIVQSFFVNIGQFEEIFVLIYFYMHCLYKNKFMISIFQSICSIFFQSIWTFTSWMDIQQSENWSTDNIFCIFNLKQFDYNVISVRTERQVVGNGKNKLLLSIIFL